MREISLLLLIAFSPLILPDAYSQQLMELSLETDKTEYAIGDPILITGTVSKIVEGHPVIIRVFNPNNQAYTFAQVDVNQDRSFSYEFVVGGKLGVPGEYRIDANYAGVTASRTITLTPAEKASQTVRFAGETMNVLYELKNGSLRSIEVDPEFLSILIFIESDEEKAGSLEVTLPRQLLDAKEDGRDKNFFVFIDGEEATYREIDTTDQHRTLLIEFPEGTRDIEIVGTHVIPEFPLAPPLILALCAGLVIVILARGRLSFSDIHV